MKGSRINLDSNVQKSRNGSHKSWLNIVMGKIKIPNISDPKPNKLEFYSEFLYICINLWPHETNFQSLCNFLEPLFIDHQTNKISYIFEFFMEHFGDFFWLDSSKFH